MLYLSTVGASVASTAFLQAPVSVHRALFRRHQRRRAVLVAHRVAMIGILFLACAVIGVTSITFDIVSGTKAAVIAALVVAFLLSILWLLSPLALRGAPGRVTRPRVSTPAAHQVAAPAR